MQTDQILVVDDEPANRELLRDALQPLGYFIREARDGVEALAEVARSAPDLILLDVKMPRMDGYSVCRHLKSDPHTRLIPIIMLTACDQLQNKLMAVDLGSDDFLNKPFNFMELTHRVRSLLSLKHFTDDLENAAKVLASVALVIESRDLHTGNHCKRLGDYGERIGRVMGLKADEIKTLQMGGIFHDLGKIAVSDSILNKPGKLTPEEFTVMKSHPVVGYDLCKGMRTMEKILPIIRSHHEKLNGTGYPDGLKNDEIPLLVRIISVCDVFDVLTTDRPYKTAFSVEKSLGILREEVAKGWWDTAVVEALAQTVTSMTSQIEAARSQAAEAAQSSNPIPPAHSQLSEPWPVLSFTVG